MNQPTPFPIEERLLQEGAEELYEHGPCGFLSMTPNGTIVSVNQTFLDWTGYAREAVIGEPLQRFLTVPGKIFYDTHYAPLSLIHI